MAVGALIGAYQEDDSGGLRALASARRPNACSNIRCAAPRPPAPRRSSWWSSACRRRCRTRSSGCASTASASSRSATSNEAVSRFEAGSIDPADRRRHCAAGRTGRRVLAEEPEPAVATVPDDEAARRLSSGSTPIRAGPASRVVDAHLLGSTAAMLGDWDLQSTLLRRAIQEGARRLDAAECGGEPLLVESADELAGFQRHLVDASRGGRTDWASRYILPAGRGFRDRAVDGNAGSAGLADLGRACADAWRRRLLHARMARRRACAAAAVDAARPDRRPACDASAEAACRRRCGAGWRCGPRRALRCSRSACGRCGTAPAGARW